MISDILFPELSRRFPDRGLRFEASPDRAAVFPAAHPEVGDVTVLDDGNEATVFIGTLTHGHFNPYDDSLSPDEVARAVTEDVVQFLEEVFSGDVRIWSAVDGGSGGWFRGAPNAASSMMSREALVYNWFGPVDWPINAAPQSD